MGPVPRGGEREPGIQGPRLPLAEKAAWIRCLFGLGCVLAAFTVRKLIDPMIGVHGPYMLFPVTVVLVGWYAGFGPGLTAMIVGGLLGRFFLWKPVSSVSTHGTRDLVHLFAYAVTCLLVLLLFESLKRAKTQARTALLEAQRNVNRLELAEAELKHTREELEKHLGTMEHVMAERTEELRETVAELEAFAHSVSHDMRTPLRALQGYATLLDAGLQGRASAEEQGYCKQIVRASARLNRMVREILSYSRVSHSKLRLEPVDLHRVVEELIEHNADLQAPHATISMEGRLPVVLGHEAALTQIFFNLLGNAAKFKRPGTNASIRLWWEDDEGRARVWVADDGIGIEPGNQHRIFQRFERINPATEYEGAGLGLALVKKAVERMKGSVGVKSEFGAGSQFWVELPLAQRVSQRVAAA